MAGFMDILGSMMKQGMSGSGGSRMSNALGAGKSGGSLDDIMGGISAMLGGSSSGQTSQPSQSGSGGLGGMLGEVLSGLGNNKAALGGLGALAGALLGGGRSSARGAVGGGGLAMLASLAWTALKKAGQAPPSPPRALVEPQNDQEKQVLEQDAEVIVKAMINAAKADGQIDRTEVEKIVGRLEKDGLTAEEKEFFTAEAAKPLDINAVIASARRDPEMAAQIYAASLLAIEVDTRAEEQYLEQLGTGLGLQSRVIDHIESTLGVSRA